MKLYFLAIIVLLLTTNQIFAQDLTIQGYLKSLPSLTINTDSDEITFDHVLHQRTNLKWFPSLSTTAALEFRTRLFTGSSMADMPGYADYLAADDGSVDMSWALVDDDDVILHAMIDRLWLDW